MRIHMLFGSTQVGSTPLTTCPIQAPIDSAHVRVFEPRVVLLAPGVTGTSNGYGLMDNIEIPPAPEYWLDFSVIYGPGDTDFDFGTGHSGKIPGLAGGTATGACNPVQVNGWSARNHFGLGGDVGVYLYHQDRTTSCGEETPWRDASGAIVHLPKHVRHRMTQYCRVNTPNQNNGINRMWLNGFMVYERTNLRWRGAVGSTVALVSQLKYHCYSGGNAPRAPEFLSTVQFCHMYLMTAQPDFSRDPGYHL